MIKSRFGVYGTVALLSTAGLSVSANAATATLQETLTIPALMTTTDPSLIHLFTNSFNQFNPSQGNLNSIDITLSGVWFLPSP
jgi:hypothetical protein